MNFSSESRAESPAEETEDDPEWRGFFREKHEVKIDGVADGEIDEKAKTRGSELGTTVMTVTTERVFEQRRSGKSSTTSSPASGPT